MVLRLALFAEAIKGQSDQMQVIRSLTELMSIAGVPKEEKAGLTLAVQALFYQIEILFFRVEEEGFAMQDYWQGLKVLGQLKKKQSFHGLAIPGVGSLEIIEAAQKICQKQKSILILTEKDLYDCLTHHSAL